MLLPEWLERTRLALSRAEGHMVLVASRTRGPFANAQLRKIRGDELRSRAVKEKAMSTDDILGLPLVNRPERDVINMGLGQAACQRKP